MSDRVKAMIGLGLLIMWSPAIIWTIIHMLKACAEIGRPWYQC